jgi:type I restriction enzyme S subunit
MTHPNNDIGAVDQEWRPSVLLAELGHTYGGLNGKSAADFGAGDGLYVTFLNVVNNTVVKPQLHESVVVGRRESQNRVKRGDLLLNGSSETPEEVGLCAEVADDTGAYLNSFCFGFRPNPGAPIVPRFLAYHLRGPVGRGLMVSLAQGSTRYNLSKRALLAACIPLPSVKEQQAIAEALSNADALIESLEQLIAKKRLLKQGVMQELLTGRRRLPGFSGAWEPKTLGQICDLTMGSTPSRKDGSLWGGHHTWLSIGDMHGRIISTSKECISDKAARRCRVVPRGTLLMSFKLSIGRLCFAGADLFTNEAICAFRNLAADGRYLYYLLGVTDFSLYGKQAVKGYTLNSASLRSIEVTLPDAAEQSAIADFLWTMDDEIDALEARMKSAILIREGMMQKLLTGRIRLT